MTSRFQLAVAMILCAMLVLPGAKPAFGETYVDLELVLAVDVSLSMDHAEQKLQRDGYVAAFRDPQIIKAIQSGPNGRIAVAYLEWAGAGSQSVVIPWQIIKDATGANAFAAALAGKSISRALMTSVSEAVSVASALIDRNDLTGLRRVIDVSGDGPNNSGRGVEAARDQAIAGGIVINGLAIQINRGGGPYSYFDLSDLDRYYKDCVIGGPGSFVLSIKNKAEFATAIRQKLLLEIAGLEHTGAKLVRKIQYVPPPSKYDCLIGEKLWDQYQRDRW